MITKSKVHHRPHIPWDEPDARRLSQQVVRNNHKSHKVLCTMAIILYLSVNHHLEVWVNSLQALAVVSKWQQVSLLATIVDSNCMANRKQLAPAVPLSMIRPSWIALRNPLMGVDLGMGVNDPLKFRNWVVLTLSKTSALQKQWINNISIHIPNNKPNFHKLETIITVLSYHKCKTFWINH